MMNNTICEEEAVTFYKINFFFRNEAVLNDTDYAAVELGYLITIAYATVILFGTLGNFLTILVVVLNPAMRTTRNFFILNLALSDFFVCTVTAPMTYYTVMYLFWPFGTALCKFTGSLQGFNVFLSAFSIAAIAFDRYVLVIFPTKRDRQQKLSLLFFALIWTTSLILAIPLLIASDVNLIYVNENCSTEYYICHEQNDIWGKMIVSRKIYTLAILVIQYAFPLCSLVFAYSRIAHRMKLRFANRNINPNSINASQRRRSVAEKQRRTHLLLMCVVAVFAIAWLPLNVFHVVNTFEIVSQFSVLTFAFCHVTGMCSACLNPLIYAFFNQNFRTEFISLFDKIGCGRWLRRMKIGLDTKKKTDTKAAKPSRFTENSKLVGHEGTSRLLPDEAVPVPLDTDDQL